MNSSLVLQLSDNLTQMLKIPLSNTDGYVLGRSDSRSSFIPDIDLAEFKALDKGVSRRHAVFVRYQSKLHILDLGSINGSFINGKRLKPDIPYLINSGDELGLGDLVFLLSLE